MRLLPFTVAWSAIWLGQAIVDEVVAAGGKWLTYRNDRYGTTIDYPDFFAPQSPPESDDGREFKSADGADFIVSVS